MKYLEALVRATGVFGRFGCSFRTELHFADVVRLMGKQTMMGGCCTRCMLCSVYGVHGVWCTLSMVYGVYGVLGVWYTQYMLYSVLIQDYGMKGYREMTLHCILQ
jgi:hypothetical protein